MRKEVVKEQMADRYFIRLSFNGSAFHGWQRQPNGRSVQQTLEEALSLLLREPIGVTGAGRTDAGVHASCYFAHFESERVHTKEEMHALVFKLNAFLTKDIAIDDIFPVGPADHARFSAISRTYQYFVVRRKEPFRYQFSHYVYGEIDVESMNLASRFLLDVNDFTSFSKVDTDTKNNLCSIQDCRWDESDHSLIFTITANRFLRNMVRAITGTMLDLGRRRMTMDDFRRIVEEKNRSAAGESAPARGLFLTTVRYPDSVPMGW